MMTRVHEKSSLWAAMWRTLKAIWLKARVYIGFALIVTGLLNEHMALFLADKVGVSNAIATALILIFVPGSGLMFVYQSIFGRFNAALQKVESVMESDKFHEAHFAVESRETLRAFFETSASRAATEAARRPWATHHWGRMPSFKGLGYFTHIENLGFCRMLSDESDRKYIYDDREPPSQNAKTLTFLKDWDFLFVDQGVYHHPA